MQRSANLWEWGQSTYIIEALTDGIYQLFSRSAFSAIAETMFSFSEQVNECVVQLIVPPCVCLSTILFRVLVLCCVCQLSCLHQCFESITCSWFRFMLTQWENDSWIFGAAEVCWCSKPPLLKFQILGHQSRFRGIKIKSFGETTKPLTGGNRYPVLTW